MALTKKNNHISMRFLDASGDTSRHGFWVDTDEDEEDATVGEIIDAAKALSDAQLNQTTLTEQYAFDGGTAAVPMGADAPYADNKARLQLRFSTEAAKQIVISVPGPAAPAGRFGNNFVATADADLTALVNALIAVATTRAGSEAVSYLGGSLSTTR